MAGNYGAIMKSTGNNWLADCHARIIGLERQLYTASQSFGPFARRYLYPARQFHLLSPNYYLHCFKYRRLAHNWIVETLA